MLLNRLLNGLIPLLLHFDFKKRNEIFSVFFYKKTVKLIYG